MQSVESLFRAKLVDIAVFAVTQELPNKDLDLVITSVRKKVADMSLSQVEFLLNPDPTAGFGVNLVQVGINDQGANMLEFQLGNWDAQKFLAAYTDITPMNEDYPWSKKS